MLGYAAAGAVRLGPPQFRSPGFGNSGCQVGIVTLIVLSRKGPHGSEKTSPMGTKPSRLRCMPYSPMFPRQNRGEGDGTVVLIMALDTGVHDSFQLLCH